MLVFYSSVVQVYVAIYIEMYQKRLLETEGHKLEEIQKKRKLDAADLKFHAKKATFMYEREEKNLEKLTSRYSKQGSKQGREMALKSGLGGIGPSRKGSSMMKFGGFDGQGTQGNMSILSGTIIGDQGQRTTGNKLFDRTQDGSVLRLGVIFCQ